MRGSVRLVPELVSRQRGMLLRALAVLAAGMALAATLLD